MRLIDADALLKEIKNPYQYREVAQWVKEQPTIEPKKGRWLPDNNNYITPHFVCSACGMSQKVETIMYKPIWAFCPRCGARMKEGEAE